MKYKNPVPHIGGKKFMLKIVLCIFSGGRLQQLCLTVALSWNTLRSSWAMPVRARPKITMYLYHRPTLPMSLTGRWRHKGGFYGD